MSPISLHFQAPSTSTSRSSSRPASPRLPTDVYDFESLSSDESTQSRRPSYTSPSQYHIHHHHHHPGRDGRDAFFAHATTSSSNITSAYQTPIQSRSSSPLPYHQNQYFNSEDEQPYNPLLRKATARFSLNSPPRPKWWTDSSGRRVRRRAPHTTRWKRVCSYILRHPLFPAQPSTILLTVTVILFMGLSITLLLMHILNPDKAPLPWRSYCALTPEFPTDTLEKLPPVGIFVGVMSTDIAVERRMLIRSTWAKHSRSRGYDGSTDRTIVRFIMGIPQNDWARRVQLEAETYKDMILLPVPENMNNGKTHAYFNWAHANAYVPPPHSSPISDSPQVLTSTLSPYHAASRSNSSQHLFPSFNTTRRAPPPTAAPHDPVLADETADWVRPQYVIKADDDAFVMLSELEARLRLEWYEAIADATGHPDLDELKSAPRTSYDPTASETESAQVTKSALRMPQRMTKLVGRRVLPTATITRFQGEGSSNPAPLDIDPMIYWGYLVKARFMAGELYALSSALVDYIATNPSVQTMVRGAEDKQTAKWMRMHPRASEVRWRSERCWIYDHPRAGTVYSHGFLFPSEVARIRHETTHGLTPAQIHLLPTSTSTSDPSLTHSTVSQFGVRYVTPSTNLTTDQEVEALVEGSPLSRLRDETVGGRTSEATSREVLSAWLRRESRLTRYGSSRVGGTIVVHFIKRNEWFLETALAFLDDEPEDDVMPPFDDDLDLPQGSDSSSPDKPEHLRVETDLSNKSPLDLSNLDSPPEAKKPLRIETDLSHKTPIDFSNLDDYPMASEPQLEPELISGSGSEDSESPKSGTGRIQTDFSNKTPLDLSNLDPPPSSIVREGEGESPASVPPPLNNPPLVIPNSGAPPMQDILDSSEEVEFEPALHSADDTSRLDSSTEPPTNA